MIDIYHLRTARVCFGIFMDTSRADYKGDECDLKKKTCLGFCDEAQKTNNVKLLL